MATWRRASGTTKQQAISKSCGRDVGRSLPLPSAAGEPGEGQFSREGAPHPIFCPGEDAGSRGSETQHGTCAANESHRLTE